ncbi:hypothetical protein [Calothrix sp. 336/3]|uniref:hypothetical protein n=1 Tax=Calothrix sp. 336/3 TaxID=1337936 RepID=UPI0004E4464B|nr:hypothetical protein [Calothrix sp. 336/3]
MTSRTTEIQTLIADVDRLLSNKRLSRLFPTPEQEVRQTLEHIREFLVQCAAEEQQKSQPSPLLAKLADRGQQQSSSEVTGQMTPGDVLAPLYTEITELLQERANLVAEIRQLEQKRLQNYSLTQQVANQEQLIADFLQVLAHRVGGNVSPQISESRVKSVPGQLLSIEPRGSKSDAALAALESAMNSSSSNSVEASSEALKHLAALTQNLDQRLLALDGTVNVVFEALERNIYTYQESLSQAIAKMYSQGLQGEQILVSLINNLAQELQMQLPSSEPFTIDLRRRTENLVAAPEILGLQAADTTTTQHDVNTHNASIDSNLESPDTAAVVTPTDFEQVVLQWQSESDSSLENAAQDEVEQLYASLFGTEEFTQTETSEKIQQAASVLKEDVQPPENLPTETETSIDDLFPDTTETPENLEVTSTNQVETSIDDLFPETTETSENLEVISTNQVETSIDDWFPETTESSENTQTQLRLDTSDNETVEAIDWQPAPTENIAETELERLILTADSHSSDSPTKILTDSDTNAADPWFDEPDTNLLEVGNVTPTELEPEISTTLELPPTADTVTSLTELLPPISEAELPHPEVAKTPLAAITLDTPPETEEVLNIDNSEAYVIASPQENLLPEIVEAGEEVSNIALDAEHLQQLQDDLANLDENVDGELEVGEETTTPLTEPVKDVTPVPLENEKKKQETSPKGNIPLLSITPPPGKPQETAPKPPESVWYLGIDLGTTGISAALLNRANTEVYPLFWSAENPSENSAKARTFRLPAEVYLPPNAINPQQQSEVAQNPFSAQLKTYLQIALPFKSERQKWEPILQLNEMATIPLVWVVRSLSKLLLTLKADRNSTTLGLTASAVGLNQEAFRQIINDLAGVICTCPAEWTEQYRFNIREALLVSKLVQHPQQVFFLEEAIASLLPELDGGYGETVKFHTYQGAHPVKTTDQPIQGSTLIINIGTAGTEMTLVDLPETLEELTHGDFMLHSFAYAGKGIEQDIICQLLFPEKWRQPRSTSTGGNQTVSSNPWQWQSPIPNLENMRFSSLGLEVLSLPRAGEPDTVERIRLQQQLESSLLGKAVQDAAIALKLILQHQDSFTLELADQRWVLQRRDLESQVFVPFVRRLNRELNKLLVAKGIPTEAINQAILTGGTASLTAVSRWLRQKLPNAKIVQDLYLDENATPCCSRVAYGLCLLPLHPQVLDVPRQQYTDYFLFTELLRLVPEQPLSFGEIIQLFEERGINTRSCQQRLMAFLEGEVPSGLTPSQFNAGWLSQFSRENPEYRAIATAPLFEKQGSLTYQSNPQQLQALRRYIDAIKGSTMQSLEEPYTVNFAIGAIV